VKQQWLALAARFDALSRRERGMIAAAVLVAIAFLGFSLVIEPQLIRSRVEAKRAEQARGEMTALAEQLAAMQAQMKDPDAANRNALRQARTQLAAIDTRLQRLEGTLVAPERMPAFLESLLSRNRNLELVALRTLPAARVIERPDERKADGAAATTAATVGSPNLYKHGVEIQIAGSYNDLLAYLTELERMPQRILWNRVALGVERYPRSVLTLTVYTLSLDRQWLVV
jgi:MSHA biogenesis protein MshJ